MYVLRTRTHARTHTADLLRQIKILNQGAKKFSGSEHGIYYCKMIQAIGKLVNVGYLRAV